MYKIYSISYAPVVVVSHQTIKACSCTTMPSKNEKLLASSIFTISSTPVIVPYFPGGGQPVSNIFHHTMIMHAFASCRFGSEEACNCTTMPSKKKSSCLHLRKQYHSYKDSEKESFLQSPPDWKLLGPIADTHGLHHQ